MSLHLEDTIGEEPIVINLIKMFIQEEKKVTKLLIMTVMEYLESTVMEEHTRDNFAHNLKDLELLSSVIRLERTFQFQKNTLMLL